MKQDVNYIKHHKNANIYMVDKKLSSTHVSIYNALFLIWNECDFDTELSINRNDVMKLSKVGSPNTYTNCLKELDKIKLIKYKPSYNPLVGSIIIMYRYDNSSDKGSVKSSSKGNVHSTDNSSDKGIDTLYKHLNKETLKLLNSKTLKLINENSKKINEKLEYWLSLEIDKKKEVEIYPTGDDFWEAYEKRVGDEVKIKKLFSELDLKTRLFIVEKHIPNYKKNQPDKKYRKNPLGYLEEKKYNDEIIPYKNEKSSSSNQGGASDAFRRKTAERLGYVQSE